jgi:hypothetical protein
MRSRKWVFRFGLEKQILGAMQQAIEADAKNVYAPDKKLNQL